MVIESKAKVPKGIKTNWIGMKKHQLCNELVIRGVYQQGDEAEQCPTMAAKLSVWEAGLWKNFRESEDLVIFAANQWRLLASEIRNNAAKMGVRVLTQQKSHWIDGMLVKKNEETIENQTAKEREAAAKLSVTSVVHSSFPKYKENITVGRANIGLGKLLNSGYYFTTDRTPASPFKSPVLAAHTRLNSTICKSLG
jgi:hypothetical protein